MARLSNLESIHREHVDLSASYNTGPITNPLVCASPESASSTTNPYLDREGSPSKFDPPPAMSGTIIRHSTPNSGKKQRPLSILSRALTSPSHSAQISKIFRDAGVSLRTYDSASASSPLSREKRMPVRQAQLTPFGHGSDSRSLKVKKFSSQTQRQNCLRMNSRKLLTNSEIHLFFHTSRLELANLRNGPKLPLGIDGGEPKTRNWSMVNDPLQNPSPETSISSPPKTPPNPMNIKIPSSIGSECHSSRRVPLVIPMTEVPPQKVEEIDNWLSGFNKASLTPEDKQSRSPTNNKENRSTSNKENSNPLYPILPSAKPISSFSPRRYSQTPSRFISPLPKRNTPMPRIGAPPPCLSTTPIPLEERLKLQNNEEAVAVKPLSPDFQRYRKRGRPNIIIIIILLQSRRLRSAKHLSPGGKK